jgi:DNA recombination protein RmuC
MDGMVIAVLLGVLLVGAVAVGAVAWASRRAEQLATERVAAHEAANTSLHTAIDAAIQHALVQARQVASGERDAAVTAALESAVVLQREHLGAATSQVHQQVSADLSSKKDVIDARLDQVHREMRGELARLHEMVTNLGRTSAEQFGQVESSLRAHAEVASALATTTHSLREALANPQARGNWGERMAEDVLRLAGLRENVNYVKQTTIDGGSGRPDYTFTMPKGQQLYMDVKFPMAAFLRYLEASTEAEREAHLKRFLSDVRQRVKELARREYTTDGDRQTVDYVLLFMPNEQLTGFIHQHDADLLDDAMGQKVVLCSPLTLFAFLGVIRQAFDNFMIEQTSDEILQLLGRFGKQWHKYAEQIDKVERQFQSVERSFGELAGTRRRQLEKPLVQLEQIRRDRGLAIEGELFADDDDDAETPPGGNVRVIGA